MSQMPSQPNTEPLPFEEIQQTIQSIYPISAAIEYKTNGELPDSYATFYLVSEVPEAKFSNQMHRLNCRYSVCLFERDRRKLEENSPLIRQAMISAGYRYVSTSTDISYPQTGHFSRTLDFRKYSEVT